MNIIDVKQANKAAKRMVKREDGSLLIPIQDGLYDLFRGDGFSNHSRFRVIRFKGVAGNNKQLYQVAGSNMNSELCKTILKELSNGQTS